MCRFDDLHAFNSSINSCEVENVLQISIFVHQEDCVTPSMCYEQFAKVPLYLPKYYYFYFLKLGFKLPTLNQFLPIGL